MNNLLIYVLLSLLAAYIFLYDLGITDATIAKNYLEACNGNVEMAISMHMDDSEMGTIQNKLSKHISDVKDTAITEDNVRAPIPQKQEVLVDHDSYLLSSQRKRKRPSNPHSVFDKFRDFQAEARQQEKILKNGGGSASASAPSAHLMRLEDLFRPPLDIMHHGTLASAQAKGKLENKWVLVNIHNTAEFSSQVLNRDIWKDPTIREIICKHFVLWQVYHDSTEGQKYMQFYPVPSWPYVSILHPVTAELLKQWDKVKLKEFEQDLREFVLVHCKPDGTGAASSITNDSPFKQVDPTVDASEESQLEAAIKASLEDVDNNQSRESIFESDSDEDIETFSDSDQETSYKGKQLLSGVSPKKKSSQPTEKSVNGTKEDQGDGETNLPAKCERLQSERWTDHTSQQGIDINILFKKPDQSRCQWCVKSQSTIKALVLYVESLGFHQSEYEIIANFPRRKISEIPVEKTFEGCGFQRQETFYIQQR